MAQVFPPQCPCVRGRVQCGNFAGEASSLPRASIGGDVLRSRFTRTRSKAALSCPDSQRTVYGHRCGRRNGSLGSLTECSVLYPNYFPAGAWGAATPTAGSGKCHAAAAASTSSSQPSPYTGSTRDRRTRTSQAETPAANSQGSGILGCKTRAAASGGKGSDSTEGSSHTSLAGSLNDHFSPSSDIGVGESAQKPPRQSRAQRNPLFGRTSSEPETLKDASSSDSAFALDAAIPAGGYTAVNGGQQTVSASAPALTGDDLPSQPTRKASKGRRSKLPPVEDDSSSSSTDEEPKRTRLLNNRTAQINTLPCPSWDDLMSTLKGKPLASLTQQGLGGAPEGSSSNEVLQALTLLGLPDKTVVKLMKPSTGLLRHQKLEGLIEKLELYREYGLSTGQVGSLLKDIPFSFSRDPAALKQILDFLLNLGVTRSKLGAVVVSSEAIAFDMDGILLPKATFLSSLGAGSVGTLVNKVPHLLKVKLSRLQDNTSMLRTSLGEKECASLLERNPGVLTFPTEHMSAFILFIQGRYHLGQGVLATMLSRVELFSKTEEARMEAILDLLESVVGREGVVDVLTREPKVLLGDTTTVQNLLMLMTPAIVRDLLFTSPRILRYDWSRSIEPALRYAVERCGVSYEDAARARVFERSLEKVLKPRVEFLLSQGMVFVPAEQGHANKDPRPSTTHVKLSTIVGMTLERFKRRFAGYRGR